MKKYLFAILGLLAAALLVTAQPPQPDRSLKVKVNYAGSGKVDEKHKVFVYLFDSPDFVQGNANPFQLQIATAKEQTVTFSKIPVAAVYVVAAFDPNGAYDGESGPPPTGASVGIYSKDPGIPAKVELEAGKANQIDLTFDDSTKMP